jgi:serine/tyrosine/threonine adenylyltransferase
VLRPLEDLRWDNSFARLPETFYQQIRPTPLPHPRLVAFNPDVAALLDLALGEGQRREFVAAFNGDLALAGTQPIAAIYAGHQFGVWVPELGDGRAILLGEIVNSRHQRWDVQLKGAGLTRFSRMGDGRAVLRSTVREYLAGEAMHGLGVPTTRSLAIIGSNAPVYREQVETGAVLVRVAPTHVRFGTFELFASRGDDAAVRQLADYVIDMHFAHLLTLPAPARHLAWYHEVVDRTARLMAAWTAIGFAHGVLNTDNMSILGISLDYGPYGWMDAFDRGFIPNHSDPAGRYAFDQQPRVGLWNCARLGEALQPLLDQGVPEASRGDAVVAALESYRGTFETEMDRLMRAKLGLAAAEAGDVALVADLLALLHDTRADYTRFFRALSYDASSDGARDVLRDDVLRAEVAEPERLTAWLARYGQRLARESVDVSARRDRMLRTNPKFVLRNWMAQEGIINAEAGNYASIDELHCLLRTPFDEHPEAERYTQRPPEWAREIAVSCSS